MSRIPYPTNEEIERKSWKGANAAGKMCAHMPDDILAGFRAMSSAVLNNQTLDPALREIAIVRIGQLSNSDYEVYYHEKYAREIGVSDEKLDAIAESWELCDEFSPVERAVLRFTDELVVNVRPSDEALSDIQAHLSTAEIFTLVVSVGTYMMVARLLETTGVEIDPERSFDPTAVARD